MTEYNLDLFVPLNIELASKLGLVNAAVAGAVWLKWNINKTVCNAGTRELGRTVGLNSSTVSRSIKYLIAEKWIVDDTPTRKGAPHDLIPSVALRNTLCNQMAPSDAERNTSDAQRNKEEVKSLYNNKAGDLATFYSQQTNKHPKGITDQELWIDDCLVILDFASDDLERAKLLISEAVITLEDLGYNYNGPGSLIKTIQNNIKRTAQNERRNTKRNAAASQEMEYTGIKSNEESTGTNDPKQKSGPPSVLEQLKAKRAEGRF